MFFKMLWLNSLFLPLVAVFPVLSSAASLIAPWPSDMTVFVNDGETILTQQQITGLMEVDPFGFSSIPERYDGDEDNSNNVDDRQQQTVLFVNSNVPVIANRITIGSSAFLEPPIPYQSALVVVKSHGCTAEDDVDDVVSVDVTGVALDNGKDYSLNVTVNTTITTTAEEERSSAAASTSNENLKSSAVFRRLQCFSQLDFGPCTVQPTPGPASTDTAGPTPGTITATAVPEDDTIVIPFDEEEGHSMEDETTTATTINNAPPPDDTSDTTTSIISKNDGSSSHAIRHQSSILLSFLLIGFSTLLFGTHRGRGSIVLLIGAVLAVAGVVHHHFGTSPVSSTSSSPSASTYPTGVVQAATTRELQSSSLPVPEQCTINVEIVYWGCGIVLEATAPSLVLRNEEQQNTWDRSTCNCTSTLTFPDMMRNNGNETGDNDDFGDTADENPFDYTPEFNNFVNVTTNEQGRNVYHVPTVGPQGLCSLAIGRPFRDANGISQTAKIVVEDDSTAEAVWSKVDKNLLARYDSVVPPSVMTTSLPLRSASHDEVRARVWTARALGEHASVASFAAFTTALMSNGAPPELIELSMVAAQDELRHAQVSFQVASLLQNQRRIVEPSVLPPTELKFGSNLTKLAEGVIKEGCIDETFSALQMAADVDRFHANSANTRAVDEQWLWNITRVIALEEGQHSVLAWKTVQWICLSNDAVCSDLYHGLLQEKRLLHVRKATYDSSSAVGRAWACLVSRLLGDSTTFVDQPQECQHLIESDQRTSLVTRLVDQIANGVGHLRLAMV